MKTTKNPKGGGIALSWETHEIKVIACTQAPTTRQL
jgi:hypothetical protein